MGMTIEEIIENLTTIRNKLCSRKYETESTLTFDSAIETIHKYQKIKEIVERFKNQYDHTTGMDLMMEIKEVVEDGKNG